MYRVLMLEDEPEEAQRLQRLIERYGEENHERFDVTWYTSAVEMAANKRHFDLMLFDIDLPGFTGIEAAELIRVYDEVTPIIFVTNLAKYAVKGYEVGALGFIVKPATYGGFKMSLDRAMRQIRQSSGRSIVVTDDDGSRVIPLSEMVWAEVRGHHTTYHLESGESFNSYGSLTQLEKDLEGAPVIRISKSFLINMDKVQRIRTSTLLMVTGDELTMSRSLKRDIVKQLADYLGGR